MSNALAENYASEKTSRVYYLIDQKASGN